MGTWAIAYVHTLVLGHNSDWYRTQMQQKKYFYYTERVSPHHQYSTYSLRQWDHCLDHKYYNYRLLLLFISQMKDLLSEK